MLSLYVRLIRLLREIGRAGQPVVIARGNRAALFHRLEIGG
jgi:hypothetical protein